jgi:hypothetical protein
MSNQTTVRNFISSLAEVRPERLKAEQIVARPTGNSHTTSMSRPGTVNLSPWGQPDSRRPRKSSSQRTCMGLFLSSGCFWFCCQFFVRSGKGRSSFFRHPKLVERLDGVRDAAGENSGCGVALQVLGSLPVRSSRPFIGEIPRKTRAGSTVPVSSDKDGRAAKGRVSWPTPRFRPALGGCKLRPFYFW